MIIRTHTSRFEQFLRDNRLPTGMLDQLKDVYGPIADRIKGLGDRTVHRPIVGINGCQGSGKSTLSLALQWLLEQRGKRAAILSIDDLYLSRARREELAKRVHPLLRTRGVPGTHDVALGVATLEALRRGRPVPLPRFDKAEDDPCPAGQWPVVAEPVDIVLFEGWCVASRPQSEEDLRVPINRLEAEEDQAGRWRDYVNRQLAGPYRALFQTIDYLILLEAADFAWVYGWRKKQENQLRQRQTGTRIMDDRTLGRFVRHFERITRHNWAVLPAHAHIRLILGQNQRIETIRFATGNRRNP